jgi:hypothetical protein
MIQAFLLIRCISFAQTSSISGKVTDNGGSAVPFASVTIKSTTKGVATCNNILFATSNLIDYL